MKQYLDIVNDILENGKWKTNRTGVKTLSITGAMFKHNMAKGFPLLTTKKVGLKTVCTELEFFIKGMTDKKWLEDNSCFIWSDWCNPQKVPYGHDEEIIRRMREERDLGRIYGVQWRKWKKYKIINSWIDADGKNRAEVIIEEIDQLKNIIDKLKTDPFDRRMIVNAWNPAELDQMALPPCHFCFQILSDGKNVSLLYNIRSQDFPLGGPFNIASYAMLLLLIARTVNMTPNKLVGFLGDVHIYENQIEGIKEQLIRDPYQLPIVELPDEVNNLFDWKRDQFILKNYKHHDKISMPIAV